MPVEARKWRAAVIGCGWIASDVADDPRADGIQAHAAAFECCRDTQLVAVCDKDSVRAERAARRWKLARGMTDISAMLALSRPQIVSICTPDSTHAAILREVMDSPDVRAVIVEKPLAVHLVEARALVHMATQRGITIAVNYSRRFSASHIDAQRRIAAGEIGVIVAVLGSYTKGVLHNGTHWFDLARWLVGDIKSVQALGGNVGLDPTDPTCHVRMTFAGGQIGFLFGLDEKRFSIFEMEIVGTAGRLRIGESGMRFTWFVVGPSPYYSGYQSLVALPDEAGGFRDVALHMVQNVVEAMQAGTAPRCGAVEGIAALAVADAARRSLATGTECTVE